MADPDSDEDKRSTPARDRLAGLRRAVDSFVEDSSARGTNAEAADSSIGAEPLARMLEISRSMYRIHDRRDLLAYVSGRLRELFDAQNSFVILFGKDGEPRVEASHVADPSSNASPISATILEQVRSSRDPIVIDDARELPDLRDRSSVEMLKIASVLCAPLIVEDQVIGALQFDHRGETHPFAVGDVV